MRVKIGDYWLAGDPAKAERDHSQCGDLQITPVRLQQQAEGWRWETPQQYDRLNQSYSVEFETVRSFANFGVLQAFMFGMGDAHAWEGTVTFREDSEDAFGTYTEFDIANCTITPPPMFPVGVSLRLRYRLLGGAVSEPRTGFYGARLTEDGEERITETDETRVTEE